MLLDLARLHAHAGEPGQPRGGPRAGACRWGAVDAAGGIGASLGGRRDTCVLAESADATVGGERQMRLLERRWVGVAGA